MKRGNYKNKLHFVILYSIIIIGIGSNIISNQNILLENKTQILKSMDETTEIANLNKTIDDLNASKTEYSNYINTSKTNLAKAITNAGVTTSGTDSFETMIANVSNILSNKTNDATATANQILTGQTAYVKGSKVTGTMANNGAVTKTLSAGGSYTIPAGYHNGSGKVTANSGGAKSIGAGKVLTYINFGNPVTLSDFTVNTAISVEGFYLFLLFNTSELSNFKVNITGTTPNIFTILNENITSVTKRY